jgi:hypothetical protein
MNFSISLEDETKEAIEILSSPLVIEAATDLSDFKLLKYLDPYGDTIVNRYQIDDLIIDLERLNELSADAIISQIISLAKRCKDEIHTYLCFNGD